MSRSYLAIGEWRMGQVGRNELVRRSAQEALGVKDFEHVRDVVGLFLLAPDQIALDLRNRLFLVDEVPTVAAALRGATVGAAAEFKRSASRANRRGSTTPLSDP
ncbi:hypothetical protein ACWDZ6_21785 [Streptomyces sp. NPDC002926]